MLQTHTRRNSYSDPTASAAIANLSRPDHRRRPSDELLQRVEAAWRRLREGDSVNSASARSGLGRDYVADLAGILDRDVA